MNARFPGGKATDAEASAPFLDQLNWVAAFTLSCCVPGKQLTRTHQIVDSGIDQNVMSSGRTYQVLVNRRDVP